MRFLAKFKSAFLYCFLLLLVCAAYPVPAATADATPAGGGAEDALPPQGNIGEEHEFSIGLGGRVGVTPYKRYDTQWTPFPIVSYEGKYAYVRGFTAGVKLVNLEFLEVSAFVGYDDTSFTSGSSSDRRLRKLSDRHSSATTGLGVRLLTHYGMLHMSGTQDVLGNSNGLTGTIGYMQSLEYGDFELLPAFGVQWNSSKYNDYYYGVNDKESRKSGLDTYDPGGAFSPYVGLTIAYTLTDAWEIFCSGEVAFLNNAIKDSPMVGRTNTHSFTQGAIFTF